MTDQIAFILRKDTVNEQSQVVITAQFRDRATAAAETPTNVYYRIDCLTTSTQLKDWTSVSPDESVDITITPTENRIQRDGSRREKKQLTVAADYGLSTQYVERIAYDVVNVYGIS